MNGSCVIDVANSLYFFPVNSMSNTKLMIRVPPTDAPMKNLNTMNTHNTGMKLDKIPETSSKATAPINVYLRPNLKMHNNKIKIH